MAQNTIDFLRESAAFMVRERPDIYTQESALSDLSVMMDTMRDGGHPTWTSFASFVLMLHYEDTAEEWFFMRKVAGMAFYPEEEVVRVWGLHPDVNLLGPEEQDDEGEPLTD